MKNNNNVFVKIAYWNNGIKNIFVPGNNFSEKSKIWFDMFLDEPWSDDSMEYISYFENEICDLIPEYNGDEDLSWNPFYLDNSRRNVFEIIIENADKKIVYYSFLDYTPGGNVLKGEDFLFNHGIPKSAFDSYFILRHTDRSKTLFDMI